MLWMMGGYPAFNSFLNKHIPQIKGNPLPPLITIVLIIVIVCDLSDISVFAQVLIYPGLSWACVFGIIAVTYNLRYEQKHKHLQQAGFSSRYKQPKAKTKEQRDYC